MSSQFTVEIWSDVVCPWCYIGKRRLEEALSRFAHRDQTTVLYRSFELDPSESPEADVNLEARLASKYGVSIEQARAMNARVTSTAAQEDLDFHLESARPGNTLDAHRLIHLAAAEGKQEAMKERLLAAYFSEGRTIAERDTLVELAAGVGIADGRAREALESGEFTAAVREDELEARRLGITGVPYFVINRIYGISGAQPADLLLQALDQAWAEAHATHEVASG